MTEEKKGKTLYDFSKDVFDKGLAAAGQGKYDEAIGLLENVNSILPIFVASALQAGRCHWEMHRWEPARKYFELANRLDPVNDDAGWTLGLLALQMGDFKAGWGGYERRWGSQTFKSPRLSTVHPQWERGLGLKRPIIWTEQGIGDQILYASLIGALAKEVESIVVLIDMRLAGLMQRGCKAKNVTFLPHNAKIKMSDHDSHIPLASMGKYFINSVRDIHPVVSTAYIRADRHRVEALRKELDLGDTYTIGLAWTSTAPIIGEHKSVPLDAFKSILDTPNVKFINLQYGKAQEEGRDYHPNLITTHIDTFLDLENTAALIANCNLIISPSCATVHIAAAMGKDVLLLDANKLWYWNNRKGKRSLWYPGVEVYQRENMNAPWDLQLKQVKEELDMRLRGVTPEQDNFVFFHVGDDISYPQKMVKSLLRHNPNAKVVMCTDKHTPDVMGVHQRAEFPVDRDNLMYSRMRAFASLRFDEPALYIDTDMIFVDRVVVSEVMNGSNVVFCRRAFGVDDTFNIEQRGLRFDEYEGKTLGELYPYVGCMVGMKSGSLWHPVLEIYKTLPEKFKKWYGDQEALREYAKRFDIGAISENVMACLPEHKHSSAKILHYKGPSRKPLFEGV